MTSKNGGIRGCLHQQRRILTGWRQRELDKPSYLSHVERDESFLHKIRKKEGREGGQKKNQKKNTKVKSKEAVKVGEQSQVCSGCRERGLLSGTEPRLLRDARRAARVKSLTIPISVRDLHFSGLGRN